MGSAHHSCLRVTTTEAVIRCRYSPQRAGLSIGTFAPLPSRMAQAPWQRGALSLGLSLLKAPCDGDEAGSCRPIRYSLGQHRQTAPNTKHGPKPERTLLGSIGLTAPLHNDFGALQFGQSRLYVTTAARLRRPFVDFEIRPVRQNHRIYTRPRPSHTVGACQRQAS
jgi:hypothetical protein